MALDYPKPNQFKTTTGRLLEVRETQASSLFPPSTMDSCIWKIEGKGYKTKSSFWQPQAGGNTGVEERIKNR
jgi:hypothetical protein